MRNAGAECSSLRKGEWSTPKRRDSETERHPAQHRQGEARARRGRLVDDGAAGARHRDRAHRQDGGLRLALRRPRAFEPVARRHGADLHGGAGDGARRRSCACRPTRPSTSRACSTAARSASSRPTCARPRRRAPWWRQRSIRRSAAAALGGPLPHLQYRSFPAAEANAALNAATMVIVQFESWEAVEKAEEIIAVEGVDMVLIGTNDLLADLGLRRPVRARQGARGLRAHHRRRPQARQARGRRRAGLAPAACRRVRQDGRALRLDRHRPRLPARRGHRARQAGAATSPSDVIPTKVGTQYTSTFNCARLFRGPGGWAHARYADAWTGSRASGAAPLARRLHGMT